MRSLPAEGFDPGVVLHLRVGCSGDAHGPSGQILRSRPLAYHGSIMETCTNSDGLAHAHRGHDSIK